MKRWLIICAILIVALQGSPLWAAIAHVSGTGTPHTTSTSSTATSCAITYTPNASTHAIVFALATSITTISSPTVSDNATGGTSTYVQVGQANNSTNELVTFWYTLSVKSGATTFTASWVTGSRNSCDLTEYSGVVGVGASQTGLTTATSNVVTTAANSWVVQAMSGGRNTAAFSTGGTCVPNNTCTLEDSEPGGGTTTAGISLVDDGNVASSGTTTTVITTQTGTPTWAGVALELLSTSPSLPTPTMSHNGGSFNNDTSTSFSDGTAGVTFCSTLDGTTPAATSPGTCSTGTSGASATVIATATTVKVLATKVGANNSAVLTSSVFTLTVGAVTDSPGAGTYNSVQTVTLGITTTTGGTVHFTTDNTTATCSSGSYSSPFSVGATEHVRAVACKTNYVTSAEINDLYTIHLPSWMTLIGVGGAMGSGGGGVLSVVQSNCVQPAGGTASPTLAFASNVTAGSTLAVIGVINSTDQTAITSVTDTRGNTYTVRPKVSSASVSGSFEAAYAGNTTGGADTVTVNWLAGWSPQEFCIFEISGAAAAPFDVDVPFGSGTTTPITSGAYTATAGGIIMAMCADLAGDPTFTAGTGFTVVNNFKGTMFIFLESSTTQTTSASCGDTGSTQGFIGGIAFK